MRGLGNLSASLFLSALVTVAALALDAFVPSLGVTWGLSASIFLFAMVLWSALKDGSDVRRGIGFVHVLVAITSVAWVGFTFTLEIHDRSGIAFLTLLSLLQNLIGLMVMIWVFQRLARVPGKTSPSSWLADLAEVAYRLPKCAIVAVMGIYVLMTVHRLSLGLVVSSTGSVMASVGIFDSIILQLSNTVGAIVTILGWFFVLGKNPAMRRLGLLLLVAQVVFGFLSGRRVLISIFVLGGLIWVGLRGMTIKRTAIALTVSMLLMGVAGPVFLELRNEAVRDGLHTEEESGRVAALGDAWRNVVERFDFTRPLTSEYVGGVVDRAGFLDFTMQIQERLQNGWDPGWGTFLSASVVEMIPSFLWPAKRAYLGEFRVEQKVQLWFGLPLQDSGPTLLTFAVADGGWLGVVLYFGGLGVLLAFLARFMMTARFLLFRFWAAAQMFSLCFFVEESLTSYIGAARFLIAFFIVDRLIVALAPKLTDLANAQCVKRVSETRIYRRRT